MFVNGAYIGGADGKCTVPLTMVKNLCQNFGHCTFRCLQCKVCYSWGADTHTKYRSGELKKIFGEAGVTANL